MSWLPDKNTTVSNENKNDVKNKYVNTCNAMTPNIVQFSTERQNQPTSNQKFHKNLLLRITSQFASPYGDQIGTNCEVNL